MGRVQCSGLIEADDKEIFSYIADLSNLPSWLPEDLKVEYLSFEEPVRKRTEVELVLSRFAFKRQFRLRVDEFSAPKVFTYRQLSGFFRTWSHTQILTLHDSGKTLLTDIVDFEMPFGILGALADDLFVRRDIEKTLQHRLHKIQEHFAERVGF